jgi:undecaprenyl-diphosphatase
MDEILKIITLAVVQGITEFLPVSSSAHLVILGKLLNIKENVMIASILHAGTLVSILLVYFKEIISLARTDKYLLKFLFISSVPAGIVGVLLHFSGADEKLFGSPVLAASGLFVTAWVLFFAGKKQSQNNDISKMNFKDAFFIGLAQCIAILPGISRAGMTISTALFLKYKRKDSSTYSFLMAIPVIAGASFLKIFQLAARGGTSESESSISYVAAATGFVVSAIIGYAALNTVIESVRKGSFNRYAVYCICFGTATLLILLVLALIRIFHGNG